MGFFSQRLERHEPMVLSFSNISPNIPGIAWHLPWGLRGEQGSCGRTLLEWGTSADQITALGMRGPVRPSF